MSTVTVVATPEPSNVPPRVRLNITSSDASSTTITRLNPDGTTVPVRTADGNPLPITSGSALLYDYEAPYAAPVSYASMESPGTTSGQVTVSVSQPWLVHPGVPALSQPITFYGATLETETYKVTQGVFFPMGRSSPVVVTDGTRKNASSSITVLTETLTSLAAIRTLLSDAGVLLLNIPATLGLGFDTCYIAVSDVVVTRLTDVNADPMRSVALPFLVVARPAGGSQSQRTYVDLLAYPTYASLQSKYATYTAVLAGP